MLKHLALKFSYSELPSDASELIKKILVLAREREAQPARAEELVPAAERVHIKVV